MYALFLYLDVNHYYSLHLLALIVNKLVIRSTAELIFSLARTQKNMTQYSLSQRLKSVIIPHCSYQAVALQPLSPLSPWIPLMLSSYHCNKTKVLGRKLKM